MFKLRELDDCFLHNTWKYKGKSSLKLHIAAIFAKYVSKIFLTISVSDSDTDR
jgi:hypothetical protein